MALLFVGFWRRLQGANLGNSVFAVIYAVVKQRRLTQLALVPTPAQQPCVIPHIGIRTQIIPSPDIGVEVANLERMALSARHSAAFCVLARAALSRDAAVHSEQWMSTSFRRCLVRRIDKAGT